MKAFVCALVALLAAPIGSVRAQPESAAADSIGIHESAREAQARFERERYRALPWTWQRARERGDEVVGRLVLLDDDDDQAPPPDPERVRTAREALLDELDRAAAAIPGDGWVLGQRVFYALEHGDSDRAGSALVDCRAARWWCRALVGLVEHRACDFEDAERSFALALEAMPADERDRWTDLSLLLDSESRRVYRDLDAATRADFERRFWRLGDPFYAIPGNDRRTEHFARHVLDHVLRDARNPFAISWGRDLREVLIRYGWPAGWERTRPRGGSLGWSGRGGIVGHDPVGERSFAPGHDALEDPGAIAPGSWSLDDDGARTTYAPAYVDSVASIAHQLAVFRRGAEAVVVAGWDAKGAPAGARAAMFVVSDRGSRVERRQRAGPDGALDLRVPFAPAVFGLELVSIDARFAARERYGLPIVPDRPVSDLLLIDRGAGPDPSLDDVVSLARGSTIFRPGDPVTLFWEVYAPGGAAAVAYTLAVRDERGGFWRGLVSAIGIGGDGDSATLEWREPIVGEAAIVARSLRVELPELPEGDYALELGVAIDGGPLHTVRRLITIRDTS